MSETLQAVRGMNDILPEDTPLWRRLEEVVREVLESYGYREIRMPLVEKTALFQRSIGEATDIVEKEMYSFEDRNGESLSLRPEGTAGCVRAALEHGLLHNQTPRLWYAGPMFRHERPQKGRYRQFHQVGVEAFGVADPELDAEMILMSARIWRRLGLESVVLQINSLGTPEARSRYRDELVAYFSRHRAELDEDSRRRLERNPLRILDSKNPALQELIAGAPSLEHGLDPGSETHFKALRSHLDAAGLAYQVNPRLVRGLDYYGRTVFEWITDTLGAQGTVCAGGRYDGLVELFGGRPTPAVGFAMGLERLVAMLREKGIEDKALVPHVYLIAVGEPCLARALVLAEELRDALPGLRILSHCGGGSFKSQFKRADRSGAEWALVLGEEELAARRIGVKPLRGTGDQRSAAWDELPALLQRLLPQV